MKDNSTSTGEVKRVFPSRFPSRVMFESFPFISQFVPSFRVFFEASLCLRPPTCVSTVVRSCSTQWKTWHKCESVLQKQKDHVGVCFNRETTGPGWTDWFPEPNLAGRDSWEVFRNTHSSLVHALYLEGDLESTSSSDARSPERSVRCARS